jgi:hypothetical protein
MDEQPRQYLLALVWLPVAILMVVPIVILLGVSVYLRAAAIGLFGLARLLLGRKPAIPNAWVTQPPHFLKTTAPVPKDSA